MLLIFYSCNAENHNLENYRPRQLEKDSSIAKIDFIFIDRVTLEENEEVIIQDIQSFSVNQRGDFYALTCPASKQLIVYDKSGRIFKTFKAWSNLSDSVALSGAKTGSMFWSKKKSSKKWHFITIDELEQNNRKLEDTSKFINNMFVTAQFIDGKLYCNVIVYIPTVNESGDNSINIKNRSVILEFSNDFEDSYCFIAERTYYGCPMAYDFAFVKNAIVTVSDFTRPAYFKKYDSMMTLLECDRRTGDSIGIIGYLPHSYETSKIGYGMGWEPKIHMHGNDLNVVYKFDKYVYARNNRIRFELKNLPYSNDGGFTLYEEFRKTSRKLKKTQENEEKKKKIIYNLFPCRLLKIFGDEENLYVAIYVKPPDEGAYLLIQKYTYSGELLGEGTIDYEEDNKIRKFDFDEIKQELLLVKKSSQGWTVERFAI